MDDSEDWAPASGRSRIAPLSLSTPASTGHRAPSAVQEGKRIVEDADPEMPGGVGLYGADPLAQGGEDTLENQRPQRRDTTETWVSDFSSQRTNTGWSMSDFSPRRTNTGWSIAASTATDMTDLSSPDVASRDEAADFEGAVSPRYNSPLMSFQKRLPFRGSSMSSSDPDKPRAHRYGTSPDNAPAPRHRRVEEISARRPSPSRLSGQSPSDAEPGPFSQSGQGASITAQQPSNRTGDDTKEPGDRDQRTPGTPVHSTPTAMKEEGLQGDEADSSGLRDDVDVPTPDETEGLSDDGTETPNGLSGSVCSETRGSLDDEDKQSMLQLDDSVIEEVCDQVLKQAFGVQLQDLAGLGAVPAAYESVSYCLDELSRIILGSGHGSAGPLICESTRGTTGSGTIPIRPAGGDGDSTGSGNGNNESQGNGGSGQKRPNGNHDGAGAGDGSPGGGKRQKVSSNLESSVQMPPLRLSCPFRKRNPVRFNIRDFQSCSLQHFSDISLLKRHVKNFHKEKTVSLFLYTCPRCKRGMGTKEAFDDHMAVTNDQICNFQEVPSSLDPEDGITSRIEDMLNGRKAGDKIGSWDSLWRLLFPGDAIPDSNFVPPIELDEVYAEFNTEHCQSALQERIQWLGEGPGQLKNDNMNYMDNMTAMFQEHIEFVFETCRSKTDGMTGRPRQTRIQRPRQTSSSQSSQSSRRPNGKQAPDQRDEGLASGRRRVSAPEGNANSDGLLSNPEQPDAGYSPSTSGYAADQLMASSVVGGTGSMRNTVPVAVPPAAHIHRGFNGQGQDTASVNPLGSQLGHHHRLQSPDSGVDLSAAYLDQRPAGFPNANVPSFRGPPAYSNLSFGQRAPNLCYRPPPQTGQAFSPTSVSMGPAVHHVALWQSMGGSVDDYFTPPQ